MRFLSILVTLALGCSDWVGAKSEYCRVHPEAASCVDGGGVGGADAGTADAGFVDAGTDAGQFDAGTDAGQFDAGPDAGLIDAGTGARPVLWARAFGAINSTTIDVSDLDLTPAGEVLLTGSLSGDIDFGTVLTSTARRPWLARLGSDGTMLSAQVFGPGSLGTGWTTAVRAGNNGSIFLTGVCASVSIPFPGGLACTPFDGNGSSRTGYTAHFTPDGGASWVEQYVNHNGTYVAYLDMGRMGFSKTTGRVMAVGGFGGALTFQGHPDENIQSPGTGEDFWVANDLDGGPAYSRLSGCGNASSIVPREVAATPRGDWYVALGATGNCGGVAYGADTLGVAKAAADAGLVSWNQKYDGLLGRADSFSVVADDDSAWVAAVIRAPYDAGTSTFTPSGANDLVVLRLNTNSGNPVFAIQVGGTGTERVSRLALDDDGGVWLYGDFNGSNFGSGTMRTVSDSGMNDVFMMRFDVNTGAPLALRTITGPGDERAGGFAVTADTLVVSGTFTQTLIGLGFDGGLSAPNSNWGSARAFVGTVAR